MKFEHFILTRFTLSHFEGVGNARLDEDYLEHRFDLFERYCLPSVARQSCRNFKWLVLFDATTPQRFKDRIIKLRDRCPVLTPCFLDAGKYAEVPEEYLALNKEYESKLSEAGKPYPFSLEDERPSRLIAPRFIKDCILNISNGKPEYYLTTRLDNDDALHRDFVKTVQSAASSAAGHRLIDFPNTYKYIAEEGIAYRYELQNNHFLSLMEPSDGLFQSVLYWNHLYAGMFLPVGHIYCHPLQMEVIHNLNEVNGFTELTHGGMRETMLYFRPSDFVPRASLRLSKARFIVIYASLLKREWRSRRLKR